MDKEGSGLVVYSKSIISGYGEDIYVKSRDRQTELCCSHYKRRRQTERYRGKRLKPVARE